MYAHTQKGSHTFNTTSRFCIDVYGEQPSSIVIAVVFVFIYSYTYAIR